MYSSIHTVRRINIETVEQWTREALRCCFIVKPDCSNIIWVDKKHNHSWCMMLLYSSNRRTVRSLELLCVLIPKVNSLIS